MSTTTRPTREIQLATGETVTATEVAPGQWIQTSQLRPRTFGVMQLVPDGQSGRYIPRIKVWGESVRMKLDMSADLGLEGMSGRTIRRLAHAGFVHITAAGPQQSYLDLQSLAEHLEAARDPEFWNPERRRRYSLAVEAVP